MQAAFFSIDPFYPVLCIPIHSSLAYYSWCF